MAGNSLKRDAHASCMYLEDFESTASRSHDLLGHRTWQNLFDNVPVMGGTQVVGDQREVIVFQVSDKLQVKNPRKLAL